MRRSRGALALDATRWVFSGSRVFVRGLTQLLRLARGGHLREGLRPWMRFASAGELPFDLFSSQGVRAVLFDLENTLIPPGGPFTDGGREIVARARAAGLAVGVVSNASAAWVPRVLAEEGIAYVAPAGKPGKDAFVRACRLLGVKPAQTVFVGDQLITDVLGAQRAGIRAVLLEPRWSEEALSSKFQRVVSAGLLRLTGGAVRR